MSEVGEVLLAGAELLAVELDVDHGRARLVCTSATLEFEGVRATTLLAPWDGNRGTVEQAKVVAQDAGELCVEVRVRFVTVPRVYRVVCRAARLVAAARPELQRPKLDASERM